MQKYLWTAVVSVMVGQSCKNPDKEIGGKTASSPLEEELAFINRLSFSNFKGASPDQCPPGASGTGPGVVLTLWQGNGDLALISEDKITNRYLFCNGATEVVAAVAVTPDQATKPIPSGPVPPVPGGNPNSTDNPPMPTPAKVPPQTIDLEIPINSDASPISKPAGDDSQEIPLYNR